MDGIKHLKVGRREMKVAMEGLRGSGLRKMSDSNFFFFFFKEVKGLVTINCANLQREMSLLLLDRLGHSPRK